MTFLLLLLLLLPLLTPGQVNMPSIASSYAGALTGSSVQLNPGVVASHDGISPDVNLWFQGKVVNYSCNNNDGGLCTLKGAPGKGVLYYKPYPAIGTATFGFLVFTDGDAADGGGLYLYLTNSNTPVETVVCSFIDNVADTSGGAIRINGPGSSSWGLVVKGCTFTDNLAGQANGG